MVRKHREITQKAIQRRQAEEEFWQTAKGGLLKRGISGILYILSVVAGLVLLACRSSALPFRLSVAGNKLLPNWRDVSG